MQKVYNMQAFQKSTTNDLTSKVKYSFLIITTASNIIDFLPNKLFVCAVAAKLVEFKKKQKKLNIFCFRFVEMFLIVSLNK